MTFNINNWRSNGLPQGGARPTLFDVLLTPPPGIGSSTRISQQIALVAKSSQLPSVQVDDIQIGYFGRKIKVQGDRTISDWTITVMNDEDFAIRSMFEHWSNQQNAFVSNRSSFGTNQLAYKVDGVIRQYSKAGPSGDAGIIRSYKLVGLWPKSISAINLDWDSTNTVEVYDVTFSMDWFEPDVFGGGESYNVVLPDDGTTIVTG